MPDDGRLTPYNIEAEESLLGAMLLNLSALRIGLAQVTASDFYNESHVAIWSAMRDLHASGAAVDPTTVADELRRRGEEKHGTGAQLVSLQVRTPATSSAARYAAIVADHALMRGLIRTGGYISELGYARPADVGDAIDEAKAAISELAMSAAGPAENLVESLDDICAEPEDERDWVIPDLLDRSDRMILVAHPGYGKRLRVDEPIPTPNGWTVMGALRPGDAVFDASGHPCRVTDVTPFELHPDAYEVVFSDGSVIEADAEHQWVTVDYLARRRRGRLAHETKVRTTAEIRATLTAEDGAKLNHAVSVAGPLELPEADLPVPPYTLGAWLGDGATLHGQVTLNRLDADEIEAAIQAEGFKCRRQPSGERAGCVTTGVLGLRTQLRQQALLGAKSIPDMYLRASVAQRKALLRGLMDTDGYIGLTGAGRGRGHGAAVCELTLTDKTLVDGAVELVGSLGIKATVAESDAKVEGRVVGRRWRIAFQCPFNPFGVTRKAERWVPLRTKRAQYRYISAVRPVAPSPMRCIAVDSADRTYLASRKMIPTHNTMFFRQVAVMVGQGIHPLRFNPIPRVRALLVDFENPRGIIRRTCQPIVAQAHRSARPYEVDRAGLYHRPGGIDIRKRADFVELDAAIAEFQPDLVCLGPLYKAYRSAKGETYEDVATDVTGRFDDLRTRHGFALLIEHHAGKDRQMVPQGSAVWERWPEFGFGLIPHRPNDRSVLDWTDWRGPREVRDWPTQLHRGQFWPWEATFAEQRQGAA